jgi:DNA-binding response OmpR family regulator
MTLARPVSIPPQHLQDARASEPPPSRTESGVVSTAAVRPDRPRVLLICPDPVSARQHKAALEQRCEVTLAVRTDDALRMLLEEPGYRLVLCPGTTPESTALEFLRQLRDLHLARPSPVMVFDSGDEPRTVIDAIQLGARQCLSGVCSPRELAAKVAWLIRGTYYRKAG